MTIPSLGEFEFLAIDIPAQTREDVLRIAPGANEAEIADAVAHFSRCKHYASGLYHVAVDHETEHGMGVPGHVAHLSIKRHDREPMQDWRVLQRIKTEIVGAETEAVELYPAESRVVDTANQYHLYAFIECGLLPLGFRAGARTDTEGGGSKQRPGSGGNNADRWTEENENG